MTLGKSGKILFFRNVNGQLILGGFPLLPWGETRPFHGRYAFGKSENSKSTSRRQRLSLTLSYCGRTKAPSKLCFCVVLFCDTVTNQQRNPEGRGRSPNGKKLPLGVNHDRLWWYCWWLPPKKIPFALLSLRNSSVSLNPNWETYETTKRRLRKKNINHVDLLRTISQIHLHVPVIVSQ